MTKCPRCGYGEDSASKNALELFHALRDEYAEAQGLSKIEAKDQLCVLYGVAVEYEEGMEFPPWPMVACKVWGRKYLRKSTTAYTKDEVAKLIQSSEEAIHGG